MNERYLSAGRDGSNDGQDLIRDRQDVYVDGERHKRDSRGKAPTRGDKPEAQIPAGNRDNAKQTAEPQLTKEEQERITAIQAELGRLRRRIQRPAENLATETKRRNDLNSVLEFNPDQDERYLIGREIVSTDKWIKKFKAEIAGYEQSIAMGDKILGEIREGAKKKNANRISPSD